LLTRRWDIGLFLALDPCPLDEATIQRVFPTIFVLHFVYPRDAVRSDDVRACGLSRYREPERRKHAVF
jgi:hypothetical protein